jgi:protein-disulfide isomerase
MDPKKFDECGTKNDQKSIETDLADGGAVGVNGTPAFFINGRMLSGAQPAEAFTVIIDEELAKSAAPKS